MGFMRSHERALLDGERYALKRLKEHPMHLSWPGISGDELAATRALEFELDIDRITKPPVEGLPSRIQPFILEIDSRVKIGFETCFMEWSYVRGSFPSKHVFVAFAVRSSDTGAHEEVAPGGWPISFHWTDQPVDVIEVPECPPSEQLTAIYSLSNLQNALIRFASTR